VALLNFSKTGGCLATSTWDAEARGSKEFKVNLAYIGRAHLKKKEFGSLEQRKCPVLHCSM
jgi:hypothetical protein